MRVNITNQPLTADYKVSQPIANSNFSNICDAINNLQGQIDELKKLISQIQKSSLSIIIPSGSVRLIRYTVGGVNKIKMQITLDAGVTWNDTGVDWDLS
jgi:hypothetical protein